MENIQNKTALITGAATGLGYRYAQELLRHGAARVAILDLSTSPGETSAATLEKEFGKGKATFFPCDVSKGEELTETFKKVVDAFNGLDILINNAGILNDQKWEQTINVNIVGLIRSSLLGIDYMGKHKGGKGGTIVNIASIVGLCPITAGPVYSASKHAVVGFSRSIKGCYEKTGIRVLVMCPGVTLTALVKDIFEKTLDFVEPKNMEEIEQLPKQMTDNVAQAMLELIQKGKNGDVWVSEGGQPPYAVDFPHYSKLALPI